MTSRPAEMWTAYTLRGGVLISSLLIGVGYLLLVTAEGEPLPPPHSLLEVAGLAAQAHPVGLASLGLFFLIATSFVRVLVAAVLFAREHDRALSLISIGVFAILLAGLLIGH